MKPLPEGEGALLPRHPLQATYHFPSSDLTFVGRMSEFAGITCRAGCTFQLEAYVTELNAAPISSWVEVDSFEEGSQGNYTIIPVKSLILGKSLKLQLHAEVP